MPLLVFSHPPLPLESEVDALGSKEVIGAVGRQCVL